MLIRVPLSGGVHIMKLYGNQSSTE